MFSDAGATVSVQTDCEHFANCFSMKTSSRSCCQSTHTRTRNSTH